MNETSHLDADREDPRGDDAGSPGEETRWHELSVEAACERLDVEAADGLSAAAVHRRLERYGANALEERAGRSMIGMVLSQFTDFLVLILLAAAIISGVVGQLTDTIAIVVILVINAGIGAVQEYRAERTLQALKAMAAPFARVRRDGQVLDVPAADLVPGDVLLLEAGTRVPADARLIEVGRLQTQEAALTGESTAIDKHIEPLAAGQGDTVGDRLNLVYRGTMVTYGRGVGVVVATGPKTEFGRIAHLILDEEVGKTPLQQRLARFGRRLGLAVIGICVLLFIIGVLRSQDPMLMFLTAITLAVAAVPEGLPAVVTITLAVGARRMASRNALVRRLPAVETLGSVTYVCSDKTGTLTQNEMRVDVIYADDRKAQRQPDGLDHAGGELGDLLLSVMALCNDATKNRDGALIGDPTEIALMRAASEAGFDKDALETAAPRVAEMPFDSLRKLMTTYHLHASGDVLGFTKGAPEPVIERCTQELTRAGLSPLDRPRALDAATQMAADGLRVLALAYRRFPALPNELSVSKGKTTSLKIEMDLTFLGLVGLIDPPRPEVPEAVRLCRSAGMTPVMITGDHPAAARAIAIRLGIAGENDPVLTGRELAELDAEEIAERVLHTRVYARVDPEQKLGIIKALREQGQFVAMTGDGVNDAPSLRHADIGVAMGNTGTDIAREAAEMVLLDDNFATIVAAVREGRRIFDNIRKFARYILPSNTGEILTLFAAPLVGLPVPLLPIQLLWINLVTDGLPGIALAFEPEEKGLMNRPPRPPAEPLITRPMLMQMLAVGALTGLCSLAPMVMAALGGADFDDVETRRRAMTMVFTVLALSQMGNVLAIRSTRESLFRQGLMTNRLLLFAVVLTVALQLAVIYLPPAQAIFKTTPLSLEDLCVCVLLSLPVFIAVEIGKLILRLRAPRGHGHNEPSP